MKKIEATIPSFLLTDAKDALLALGITGLTVIEAKTYAPGTRRIEYYRGLGLVVDSTSALRLEIVTSDDQAEIALDAISSAVSGSLGAECTLLVTDVRQVASWTSPTGADCTDYSSGCARR